MKKRNVEIIIKDLDLSEADKSKIMAELESKEITEVAGTILEITIAKDGVSCIQIRDLDGSEHILCHPADMTDAQLDEFKRAQNHGFKVAILYCVNEGDKDLIEITVKTS